MHPRLKKIIFNKLYEDLKHVEIIHFENSIWFIDREKKYWYLEWEKDGILWWKYDFFTNFFRLFSMERSEFERVIADWVEEVLNFKVYTTGSQIMDLLSQVEEVLNLRVNTVQRRFWYNPYQLEEVLNSRVKTTFGVTYAIETKVEEILNSTL